MSLEISFSMMTPRTLIEPVSIDDHVFIMELVNTEGWIRFIGDRNVTSLQAAVEYVGRIMANPQVVYWVVKLRDTLVPIGVVTLIKREYLPHPDIGFAFLPQYTGNGFAVEAVRGVLNKLQQTQRQSDVMATTVKGNDRSVSLLKKLGFCFQNELVHHGETLNVYKATDDQLEISSLVNSFFQVFTNKDGRTPDWSVLSRLCIPEVLLVTMGDRYDAWNFSTFVEPRAKILSNGTLTDFEEHEVTGVTEVIGGIAQHHSTYSKRGKRNGKYFQQNGNKIFQFIKTDHGWRVSSVVWQDEPMR